MRSEKFYRASLLTPQFQKSLFNGCCYDNARFFVQFITPVPQTFKLFSRADTIPVRLEEINFLSQIAFVYFDFIMIYKTSLIFGGLI